MQFLPVVHRELLVAARKRGTYLSRTLSAGVLLAGFAALLSVNRSQPMFSGAHILQFLSAIVFFECMLAGMRYTADCLSEEKREGTLGLLFLTRLKGFDVVLGKMIARSLGAIFNLVAVIPILALTVLVGGVAGVQVTALSIALLTTTVFSLCAGAFVSSRGYRERGVLLGTLAFLFTVTLLPIMIGEFGFWLMRRFSAPVIDHTTIQALKCLSPLHAFREAGRGFVPGMLMACWTLVALSATFIAYASWRIRHCFGEPEKAESRPPLPHATRRRRASLASRVFAQNPVLWLAARSRMSPRRILMFGTLLLIFGIAARAAIEAKWSFAPPLVILGSYGAHALYKFLITAESARQLNEDKRSGALELLLTSPIHARQVFQGQITATRKAWLPVGVCVAMMNLTWMTADDFPNELRIILPCSIVLLVFDSYALCWRAVLNALKGERYSVTVFKTFSRVIVPPIAVISLVLAMRLGVNTGREAMEFIFIVWTTACVLYDLTLITNARVRLRKLRAIAAGDERIIRVPMPLHAAPITLVSPARAATSS
jgi:ABC-type transport system involved in cytochrome c biogenesis permease component